MTNKILASSALFLLCSTLVFADPQVITLKDGSQIKGNLVGVSNGVYTIETPAMGNVTIQKEQISSIAAEGAMPAQQQAPQMQASSGTDVNQKMQAMQAQLMSNPEYVADLQAMAQDPEIMQLLSDPALVQAVTSKDINTIQSNPRAQALMNNPKMRAFIEKLRGSNTSQ